MRHKASGRFCREHAASEPKDPALDHFTPKMVGFLTEIPLGHYYCIHE